MVSPLGSRRLTTVTLTALAPFLLSCCCYIDVARANFFANPAPKWSIQLQGSGRTSGRGLRKGNSIVSAKDGTKVVVTANDGTLHIIQTTNQVKSLAVYVPDVNSGRKVECVSGAVIVDKNQQNELYFPIGDEERKSVTSKEDFIVYALIDSDGSADEGADDVVNNDRGSGTTSRIIAVNMEGALNWSVSVPGRIEGTPVVGKTGIYVTHNAKRYGALSILRIQPSDGKASISATVSTLLDDRSEPIPLGPPALQKPAYWDDASSLEDVIIVSGNWENGSSQTKGGIYMLSSKTNDAKNNKQEKSPTTTSSNANFELVQISSWSLSASAAPMVYGESIFVAAAGGTISGFTGDKKNDLSGIASGKENDISPRWNYRVSPNPSNASQPIQNQPVLDSDGEYLFVSGVNNDLYCLQSDNGKELWKAQEGSQIMARPHVFEGADWRKVVYVIESENGRVRQYDLYSGRRYWDYSCADISNQLCQNPVEADFAITPSGNTIYYGDIFGRIHSIEVGNFETESPTISPTSIPTTKPSPEPTLTPTPTGVEVPTQMPQERRDSSSPTSDTGGSINVIVIDGDSDQPSGPEMGNGSDMVTDGNTDSNTAMAASFDQQTSSNDSSKLAVYVGSATAGLCVLMIPIVLLSLLRRRRKKSTLSNDMVVEIIDDCSSDDLESQSDLDYFKNIETNDSNDPNDGDGIEVEIIEHVASSRRNQPNKKIKRNKGKLPDTPGTINSLESIDETLEDPSAMVVVEDEFSVPDPPVEAVNLRQTFERAVVSPESSNTGDKVDDSNYFSDDDIPPPPPVAEESLASSSKEWTWGSLLQIGTVQSSKSGKNSSEISLKKASNNIESKQSARAIPPPDKFSTEKSTRSRDEISTDKQPPIQKELTLPGKKLKWRKKAKKNLPLSSSGLKKDSIETDKIEYPKLDQSEKSQTLSNVELNIKRKPNKAASQDYQATENQTDEFVSKALANVTEKDEMKTEKLKTSNGSSIPPPQTPTSPLTYSMVSETVQSLSPVRSIQSAQESSLSSPNQSSTKSVGSDDESLYTSYTSGTHEKKQESKDLSPLSNFVYNQDVYRRDRSEIINEGKAFLAQPVLSKSYAKIGEEEHPDDERSIAPGTQYLSDDTNDQKYGRSVRSKRDSNSFNSNNSTGKEFSHKPLAEMYDQLAAIGLQRREEKKPGFRRRNKKLEREGIIPQQEEEQEGDTWNSFLNELLEAEEQFFKTPK